jgi:hypothetical protein
MNEKQVLNRVFKVVEKILNDYKVYSLEMSFSLENDFTKDGNGVNVEPLQYNINTIELFYSTESQEVENLVQYLTLKQKVNEIE